MSVQEGPLPSPPRKGACAEQEDWCPRESELRHFRKKPGEKPCREEVRRNLRAHTGLPRTDRGKRRWVLTASRELEEVQEASVAQAAEF